MKLVISVVVLLLVTDSAYSEAIEAGKDIIWTIKESSEVNTKICLQCPGPGTVTKGSVFAAHCSQCFGLWKNTTDVDYCLYYIGPPRLDYDRVKEYSVPINCINSGTTISTRVVVKVTPNTPPYFNSPASVTVSNPVKGTELTAFTLVDPDTFDKMTFTLEPSTYSSKFQILNKSGNSAYLEPLTDLSEVCEDTIEVKVKGSDGFNPAVGPITITVILNNNAPVVTSMNRVIEWEENRRFYQYFRGTNVGGAGGACSIQTDPSNYQTEFDNAGCGDTRTTNPYFQQTNTNGFDFEKDVPVNISLTYSKDGRCPSKIVWLYLRLKDVNEKPTLSLNKDVYNVEEGVISFIPEYNMVDPDSGDTHTYEIVTQQADKSFEIDKNTGRIFTKQYFNLNGAETLDKTVDVQVKDKAGLASETVQLTITIKDVNNNAPKLNPFTTTYYIMECQAPGLLQTITAQDNDAGVNKDLKFIAESSGTMTLDEAGLLKLTGAPINKQFDSINIQAVDLGTPQKFSSIKQVSVIGQPCNVTTPAPTPPPTPAPTTTPTTLPPTTTPPPEAAKWWDDPLTIVLVSLAGLLSFVLVVLAGCCIARCCCRSCSSTSPKGNMIQPQRAQAYNMKNAATPRSNFQSPRPSHLSPTSLKQGKPGEGDNESGVYSQGGDELMLEDGGGQGRGQGQPGGQGYGYGEGHTQGQGYGYGEGYDYDDYFGGNGNVVGDPSNDSSYNYWKEDFGDREMTAPTNRKALPSTIHF